MHFNNILVIIESYSPTQEALTRAMHLAQQQIKNHVPVKLSLLLLNAEHKTETENLAFLDELLAEYDTSKIEISKNTMEKNNDYDAIVALVEAADHDLVVKFAKQNDSLTSIIVTPFDWQLLRRCPCPMLFVKSGQWQTQGRILVAVNVSDSEDYHAALNKKLVCMSMVLAKVLDRGNIHLVNAYPSAPTNIAIDLPEFNPTTYNENVRGHYLVNMKALRQQFGIDEDHTHVYEGLPEDVIPQVAEEIDAELVILGTIGRTGLSAAFLGNTAEHLIDHLNCDLLAIKPDPIEEDENTAEESE